MARPSTVTVRSFSAVRLISHASASSPNVFIHFNGQQLRYFIDTLSMVRPGFDIKCVHPYCAPWSINCTYPVVFLSLTRRIHQHMMFVQGGQDSRYISLPRISPGRLVVLKLGGTEFLACKDPSGGPPRVACALNLGTVEWSNVTTGEPYPRGGEKQRIKKGINVFQISGWSIREQSCICTVFECSDASPLAQMGWEDDNVPISFQFTTKLLPQGMFCFSFIIRCSTFKLFPLPGSSIQTSLASSCTTPGSLSKRTLAKAIPIKTTVANSSMQGQFKTQLSFNDDGNVLYYTCHCHPLIVSL